MPDASDVDVIGYADRLVAAPGDAVGFHVSCRSARYDARLVRLVGDDEVELASPFDGEHPGRAQGFASGSYVLVEGAPPLELAAGLEVEAFAYPTTPGRRRQALVAQGELVLGLGPAGDAELRAGTAAVATGVPLRAATWYRLRGSLGGGELRVEQEPVRRLALETTAASASAAAPAPDRVEGPIVLAARLEDGRAVDHFDGKLDSPRLGGAAWDLALRAPASQEVRDTGPRRLHGRCVNMPLRGVTGVRWTGDEPCWRRAPDEYAAIRFHDDDLEDARWEVDFELVVPDDLPSGIYAARLRSERGADHVPFVVRPPRGRARARAAFLVPTLSYLAYGSEQMLLSNPTLPPLDHQQEPAPLDHYAFEHRLRSLYDRHTDGSGVALASRLRPLTNMRPGYVMPSIGAPHQLPADLHLVGWLDALGHEVDFVTDEDLHAEGVALLAPYRVVLTGSHPEYWTGAMLDGLETYLDGGGRFMYLGGNGLYWVTAIDPERPHVIEVRRGHRGTGTWRSEEGETWLQTTGEPGGLWRERGRAPQRYVGVGMDSQGFDRSLPYVREPASGDPRAAWIFEGVGDGPIGDYGLVFGGAAGLEVDRLDLALGTPPHALLLATATGFSDSYQHVVEEVQASDSRQGGSVSPFVRADMVFFETPGGGAVFSTGSIAWCGALSHNGCVNDVSRITDNVLRRFASDEPLGG